MKMFFIIILLIIPFSINAQDEDNSKYALELSSNFKRLEPIFVEFYKEKLTYFLKNDKSIKNKHLYKDTSFLNKLTVEVIPVLKFKKEALNYKKGQNILSLLEIDTIDYSCSAKFYLSDTLKFAITLGYNLCDECNTILPLTPGAEYIKKSGNRYEFYDIADTSKMKYKGYVFNIKLMPFYFNVNGFAFSIQCIYLYPEQFTHNSSLVNIYLSENIIRNIAKNYPVGGKPWWKFW